jgi:hypothetical protein
MHIHVLEVFILFCSAYGIMYLNVQYYVLKFQVEACNFGNCRLGDKNYQSSIKATTSNVIRKKGDECGIPALCSAHPVICYHYLCDPEMVFNAYDGDMNCLYLRLTIKC